MKKNVVEIRIKRDTLTGFYVDNNTQTIWSVENMDDPIVIGMFVKADTVPGASKMVETAGVVVKSAEASSRSAKSD